MHYKIVVLSVLFAPLVVGCGPRKGIVSGEVVYKDKPVPGGLLTFQPADTRFNSETYILESDGKFKIELPVGEVRVFLDNREYEPKPATMPATPPGVNLPPDILKAISEGTKASKNVSDRWVKIPSKYYQLETSDLSFVVNGGEQSQTIQLRD